MVQSFNRAIKKFTTRVKTAQEFLMQYRSTPLQDHPVSFSMADGSAAR